MCHVLIIEDEWLIAEYLSCLAAEAGATSIATAVTEDDAVQSAHDHAPGIILSDVNLLVGTGPRAVQAIMAAQGKVPVIFVTASPDDCPPFEPTSVVMTKPVDKALLISTFRRLAPGLEHRAAK